MPRFHGSHRIRTCVHTLLSLFVLGCPSDLVCALVQRVHHTFKIWLEMCATSRLYSSASSLCRFSIFLHIHLAFPACVVLPYMHSTRLGIVICGSWRRYDDTEHPATIPIMQLYYIYIAITLYIHTNNKIDISHPYFRISRKVADPCTRPAVSSGKMPNQTTDSHLTCRLYLVIAFCP